MARRKLVGEFEPRLIRRPAGADNVVKSAQRVLEILEFFDDYREEASVVQVAEALGYPQSSTSALLKSLAALGYLYYNVRTRTYISSPRVALLGSWLNSSISREGDLIEMMHELNEDLGEAVALIARNGLHAQYIHVVQSTDPSAPRIGIGHLRPLVSSGAGYALLSTMADKDVTRLVMRANAEAESSQEIIKPADLHERLKQVRRVGYSVAIRSGVHCGLVASLLPALPRQAPLMIGIIGNSERISERSVEIGRMLCNRINKFHNVGRIAA